ncbi:hypothetical protein [Microbulbifer guangxiensis]|uniref:hypothetical protein n=1 Tax=Microbulbifer guangxiensis TaxID=2904249 RepID=UPI001F2184F2|nr:hypothetical protein [Microbulbifer guangxiensis]
MVLGWLSVHLSIRRFSPQHTRSYISGYFSGGRSSTVKWSMPEPGGISVPGDFIIGLSGVNIGRQSPLDTRSLDGMVCKLPAAILPGQEILMRRVLTVVSNFPPKRKDLAVMPVQLFFIRR